MKNSGKKLKIFEKKNHFKIRAIMKHEGTKLEF